jgi:tol-pal system protein YbgF
MIIAALGHMLQQRRVWRLLPLTALVAVGGCFATRSDVRIVQSDVASLRTELLRNDAEQRATLAQAMKLLAAATDSLTRISARTVGIQGDVRGEMRGVKEQLLQVQTLLGQSQANINRIRSELEARAGEAAAPPPVATATPVTGTTPPLSTPPATGVPPADSTARGPGPSQLYTNGLDQMKRGSTSTARTLFQELLSTYPGSDLAPAAQFYIAESLNKEKNLAGADVAYAAVVTKYGDSPFAPTALYKRALIAVQQGNTADARRLLNDVISRFPKSDEAELAADELKRLR